MHNRFPEPTHLKAYKWRGFFLFILVTLVLASLLAIVHVQHQIRNVESQYYQSLKQALVAKEQWGRLMLEKEHLTSPTMVEQVAKQKLHMTLDKTHYFNLYIHHSLNDKSESSNLEQGK
ncbi:cell division protein FtsL [Thiomicrorhabdus sp. Milos-T2]|uniref:cell division protein FtsL n=1 Tax=Thiomicrorhabdus sp. Milos-T2 TaxID=90814 RepID=UPI00068B6541|nr:cell division protein FtsL [Thiomicrorhabdus sp. Milos-T2]